MQSKLLIGAVALIAVGVIGIALLQPPSSAAPAPAAMGTVAVGDTATTSVPASQGSASTPAGPTATSGYALADVAKHASAASCWAAIDGNVYDLTSWINQHPGGPQRILNICGTDATSAFNAQHGGQRQPAQELTRFYLGALAR